MFRHPRGESRAAFLWGRCRNDEAFFLYEVFNEQGRTNPPKILVVEPIGIEPTTSGLQSQRSPD